MIERRNEGKMKERLKYGRVDNGKRQTERRN